LAEKHPEVAAEVLWWGQNYDEDHKLLPQTIYKPIKELKTDHIQAILDTVEGLHPLYRRAMLDELSKREN